VDDSLNNPAFLRWSPEHNIVYACSESIENEDCVAAFSVVPHTGSMKLISKQPTKGKSACYITLSRVNAKHLLVVNYWDSILATLPVTPTGTLGAPIQTYYAPKANLAKKRSDHLSDRHSEAHAHAIVLDPILGKIAYVPDLGEDVVKQFVFNPETGALVHCGNILPSNNGPGPYGPRYLEFHPKLPLCFLVNEISSSISVFAFNDSEAELLASDPSLNIQTLVLVQTISTIPLAFPKKLNTCGRVTVDPSGNYVLVSNRGHNSIAVFTVLDGPGTDCVLRCTGFFHTKGSTPRHFQFDPTGTHLIVANQDTDHVTVFKFHLETGTLTFTGNEYYIPSPNFVCCVKPHTLARL